MAKKSCKQGYYYCYTDKKCKKLPRGYVIGMGGYLRKEKEDESSEETKKNGNGNGNGNGSNGNGNGNGGSNGGSNGGGVSEAWSAKYKKSIDCDNPKGFSQRAHCRGRKMNEQYMTTQQKAERYAETLVNKARGTAAAYDAAKKKAENVKTTSGSVTIPEEVITEKRDGKSSKDKGYSLRDWFRGGGWKQTGGKYDGKPCARQPGQKTKPYCRDADDRAAMSKEERNKRAARKRKEDPNPNKKGKAKNVRQESYSNWRTEIELDEGVAHAIRLGLAAGTAIAGGIIGKKAHDAIKGMTDRRNKRLDDALKKARGIGEGYDEIRPYDRIKMGDGKLRTIKDIDARLKDKKKPVQKNSFEPEGELVDEGKKDACYHKVKSRYSVWPSAYASGALVKCRKVGAKNWGNKTKKEGYEYSNWKDDFVGTEYESVDIIKPEPLQPTEGIGSQMLDEAPMVEPSTSAAPAQRPSSMMQQLQSLRAMRMRSMQRQGLPLEAEKIRSKLSTSEVNASNERARELDKIRRQSKDATIARSRTQQPASPARGPIARTPLQQKGQTAPVTKTQPTSTPAPQPSSVPAVTQAQRNSAASLDDATLKRYNMDPKVVKPQPEVKPQPQAPVRPAATGGKDDVGTTDDNTKPGVVPLKVEPAPNQSNQSSSQQQVQQVASATERSFNDRLFGRLGYIKSPIGDGYISPKQLRDMEREMRTNKNYNPYHTVDNPLGFRKFFNTKTNKIEIPEEVQLDEKCWKGYEKKGMKTMFGKRYPNCVKKKKTRKEEVELDEKKDPCWDTHEMKGMKKKGNRMVPNCVPKEEVELTEAPYKRPADGAGRATSTPPAGVPHADDSYVFPSGDVIKPGTVIDGSRNAAQAEREKAAKKRRQQVRMDTLNRIIKDNPKNWDFSNNNVERRMMTGESSNWRAELAIQEDWQKANRKDKTDGMSQKAVDAYKRENPGSKLKTAVTGNPKKGSKDAKRRKSFCSRSNGQRKMHNIDCSKTPDKKICKARRRWKC